MTFRTLAVAVVVAALAGPAAAQTLPQDPTQFDMLGFIEEATLDACPDVRCGGSITVNGQRIVVPAHTILQMPATALPWKDVFTRAPYPYGMPGAGTSSVPTSGLALSDDPPPRHTFEAHVIGNRVGDTYVAGLVYLAQHSLQASEGFITLIDYATGFVEIDGVVGTPFTGQRVMLNDPLGRFARRDFADERFTVDEDNPTVRSDTGYPMCIPRSDPAGPAPDAYCPQSNRPTDATSPTGYQMIFTMPPPPPAGQTASGPDPRLMAPFEVGDHVSYSGILVEDPSRPGSWYVAAFSMLANVGIFTSPGSDPAYVAVDVSLLGVGGVTLAGLTEASARTRFEGFTTDPTRPVDLFAVDLDPCTGLTPDPLRDWGSSAVDPGPPTGAVAGRWRFRPPSNVRSMPSRGAFLPATRDVRAVVHGAQIVELPDAVDPLLSPEPRIAGTYQSPIAEFIFPEPAGPGKPIVANNFQDMPFLARGSGRIDPAGPVFGQLSPWPGAPIAAAPSCDAPTAPVANAGAAQAVPSGATVTLDGSASTDGGAPPLTYLWTQTSGQNVQLATPAAASTTFVAPLVLPGAAAQLTFSLQVTNQAGAQSTASVTVTVNPIVADLVSISLVEYRVGKQRLTVNAGSSDAPAATLRAQAFDGAGAPLTDPQIMLFSGGVYLLDLVGVPQPASVTVTSDHGGTATSGITRLR